MRKYLSQAIHPDLGLLLLRLGIGPAMMVHGLQKLNNFSQMSDSFLDPIGIGSTASLSLAIFAELVCSAFLMLGLFTPLVIVPLISTMLVAMFIAHGQDPWSKKEMAFLYLVPYITLLFTGPGRFSLDRKLFSR